MFGRWPKVPAAVAAGTDGNGCNSSWYLWPGPMTRFLVVEPPIRSWILIGSSNGWLITADEGSELLLVDPFTSEQIALPLVVTIEHVKPIFDDSGTIHKFELSYYTGEKVYAAPEIYILAMISVKSSTTRHLCSLIVLLEAVLWCLSTIHIFSFCLCDQGMISGLGCHPMQDTEIACTGVVYCMH